jgi:hypothetical protein
MGTDPIHLAVESTQNENAFFNSPKHAVEAVKIIQDCEEQAFEILQRNKLLLLKMAEYLTSNSRMEASTIESFVRKYSKEEWVERTGFIKKEEYYQFNRIVKEQLKTLENNPVNSLIENLLGTEKQQMVSLQNND